MTAPDDPRCEWIQILLMDGTEDWLPGRCNHIAPVPVESTVTGETLAWLCTDCDTQLPAHWRPSLTDTYAAPDLIG